MRAGAAPPSLPWPVEVTGDERSTVLTAADGGVLRVHRALDPTKPGTRPATAAGRASGAREAGEGTRARAVFAAVRVDGPAVRRVVVTGPPRRTG